MNADLSYSVDGMFTTFLPNTTEGRSAWYKLAAQTDGTGKVFTAHLESTLRQLRAAGYSVHKSKPVDTTEADALLEALSA